MFLQSFWRTYGIIKRVLSFEATEDYTDKNKGLLSPVCCVSHSSTDIAPGIIVLGIPTGDTQNTSVFGTGVPKTRGNPKHCDTAMLTFEV